MRPAILLASLLLMLGVAHPGAAGGLAAQSETDAVPNGRQPTLLSGDALEVNIWREPDLSGTFLVDPSGAVTLPLLGSIDVTGIPLSDLRDRLIELYARDLRNPSINITPRRRVYVLGEVNQPGLLALDPTVTLAGAIAMAGGASREGDISKIRILRDGEVLLEGVGPDVDLLSIDIRSGDQITVDRRGWFDRNSTFVVSATIGAAGIIVQLLR